MGDNYVKQNINPGPRPGNPHSGQFKAGHDPRRTGSPSIILKDGRTLAQVFRSNAPDAIDVILEVMRDTSRSAKDRMKAAEYVLERGFGKIPQPIAAKVIHEQGMDGRSLDDLQKLTTAQLMAIASQVSDTIEGAFEVVIEDE